MKPRTWQVAFGIAFAGCIVLTTVLVLVLKGRLPLPSTSQSVSQDPVVARGPESGAASSTAAAVRPGEPSLAPIQLSPARMQQIGVTSATASYKDVVQQLNAPGDVEINEQRLAYVQTRFAGWIQQVFANANYQFVRKGQKLFTIYSPDLVSTQQEYLLARQNQKTFSGDMHGMASKESGWLVQAAEERLRQFGVPAQLLSDIEQSGKVQREIAIEAPTSGFITERNALPNAYVQPDTKLYTIADLSTVWVYANVFQNDVGRLKPGDPAQVTVDAYPGRRFRGRIDQILPQVDATTRTVRVRLVFSNPGVLLKPGMYVNVAIKISLGKQLVVPSSAVLHGGDRSVAFLDHGDGNLEPRTVETGPQLEDGVVILNGLKPGDKVVSSANFLVDSEAQLQSAFAAAAQQAPTANSSAAAQELKIDFSTQPDPPHRGANSIRMKLTGADGKPISGVEATVDFNMPAMPAMGMAAMHSAATLADKGNGIYEGPLQLDSGGTWQVTIRIRRGGQVLATKHLNVNAEGGMA